MKTKRILSACLTAALILGCFTGCNKPQAEPETEETASRYAYKASYLPMTTHTGEAMNYVQGFCVSGDKVYYSGSYIDGMIPAIDEITGEPVLNEATGEQLEYENYVDGIFVLDTETKEIELFEGYEPAALPEGMKGNSGISQVLGGADGSIWIFEEQYTYSYDLPENFDPETGNAYDYYIPGENYRILSQYSADGSKLSSVTIQAEEDVYFGQMHLLTDGRILAYDWQNVYIYDNAGVLQNTISTSNGGELSALGNDRFAMVSYDPEKQGQVLLELDLAQGKFVERSALPVNAYYLYPGTEDYDYLYRSGDTMFGMKEGAAAGEKLFSWIECDVDSNNVEHIIFLDNGSIAALERDYGSTVPKNSLILMEQVDPATIPEKQELTLGCMSLDWELRSEIVKFNRSQDEVRIIVKDYSETMESGDYEAAYEAAVQKLTTEILSGSAPDILCVDGLPVEQYAAKGILLDLWPLIDSDPELSREDLMTHFFDVLSIDGKLYQAASTFTIQTAATYTEIANGRTSWTMDEMLAELDKLPEGAAIFGETDTSDYMLQQMVSYNLDSFMDWETGTCNFDNKEFIDILNFAAKFPKEFNYDDYDWDTSESAYTRMRNGKQLMMDAGLHSFDDVQFHAGILENNISYIGYPTESGSGSSFSCYGTLSISSTCENVDAAWSLVRTLLLEENQITENMYNFPTNKHAFDAYAEQAMTAEYTTDPETGEQVEVSQGGIGYNDIMIELYAIKQEDYDAFIEVYENCNSMVSSNEEVMEIINDHAAAFFDGQKTAEETAKLIQDGVGLYMMEQG